jgi:uncharacterized protein (DUF2147 family)
MLIRWTLILLLGGAVQGVAEEADAITGQWLTSEGEVRIDIFREDGKYFGKIVWLKEPVYPDDDPEAGKPVRDRENPDPAKRGRPVLGLMLLSHFEYAGNHRWVCGGIYNPENGKTYRADLSLTPEGALKVRGFVGIRLLGRSTVWTRYKEEEAPCMERGSGDDKESQP